MTNPSSRQLSNEHFWADITRRESRCAISNTLPPIEPQDRYSITDDLTNSNSNNESDHLKDKEDDLQNEVNRKEDERWKQLLRDWGLEQYIGTFEGRERGTNGMEQWRSLSKEQLLGMGLLEVDAEILLNQVDSPRNVANGGDLDIDAMRKRVKIKAENQQSVLDEMDEHRKEVMKSMADLMTMSTAEDQDHDDGNDDGNDNVDGNGTEQKEDGNHETVQSVKSEKFVISKTFE